jgi:hypothetical protein
MIRLLSTRRLFLFSLFSICFTLQGCASRGEPEVKVKIGMHVDAVLEFIVEYPLSWNKDRRLVFDSKEGEVRWTHPDHPQTLLRIRSFVPERQAPGIEQQIDQALHEYVELEISTREAVTLPAGEAWHITGQTAQVDADIYLLLRTDRGYSIELTAPRDNIDAYEDVMDRVTHSFRTIP